MLIPTTYVLSASILNNSYTGILQTTKLPGVFLLPNDENDKVEHLLVR